MAKSFSKTVLAGLAGLAAGIVVGVLIAPDKGSKTRKRIKKKFQDMEGVFRDLDLPDKLNDLKSIFTKDKEEKTEQDSPPNNDDKSN
jgi:gas vesicle protein